MAATHQKEKKVGDLYDEIMEGEKPLDPELDDLFIDDSEVFANVNISSDY